MTTRVDFEQLLKVVDEKRTEFPFLAERLRPEEAPSATVENPRANNEMDLEDPRTRLGLM